VPLRRGPNRAFAEGRIGFALIAHARQRATCVAQLDWIDLQVISENRAALALYRRAR
jgi:ribosomal protein S18 acetylase RimI-like enzyme